MTTYEAQAMKVLKRVLKVFVILIILAAVAVGSVALYVNLQGKEIIASALSKVIGANVKFDNISMNLEEFTVNFKGLSIPSDIGFDKTIFNAEKFSVKLNKELLERKKKVVFDQIYVKRGVLNILRNKNGVFNVSRPPSAASFEQGLAYADNAPALNFYSFAKNVKSIIIEDTIINFEDKFVPGGPFAVRFDDLNAAIEAVPEIENKLGSIPVDCAISFAVPGRFTRGRFSLKSAMHVSEKNIDLDARVNLNNIDLMQFLPYFNSYTPFTFYEGHFTCATTVAVANNNIDSITELIFHKLRLSVDPGMENAQFLESSVNKLTPYLTSGSGELVFDFIIKGPLEKPRIGMGPKVKFAVGMVVVEEVGNLIQQLQKLRGIR